MALVRTQLQPTVSAASLQGQTEGRNLPWAGLAFTLGYAALIIFLLAIGNNETDKVVSNSSTFISSLVATVWSLWGFRRGQKSSRGRLSANLLSLSLGTYFVGAALFTYYELIAHSQLFPSWADAGFLGAALFMCAATLLLPGRRMPGVYRVRVLLDSLMTLAALVTFSWFFALGPTVLAGDQTTFAKVLGAAYPVLDLAMLFCLLVLSGTSSDPSIRRARVLLCAGIIPFVVADSAYLYLNLKGTYHTGEFTDIGWVLANLLIAQAAAALRKGDQSESKAEISEDEAAPSLGRTMLPYLLLPAVAALLLAVYNERTDPRLGAGVYVGSGLLLGLLLVRQVLAIAESSRLYQYLQAAYKELEALATTDAMTGLPNHRMFQTRLRNALAETASLGKPTSLILIDVDRFKAYNDGFGHLAGDEALKIVGALLRQEVRPTDLAARYGGEEFAVILPNTHPEVAMQVAEQIRSACEATAFPHRAVTLSLGVAVAREEMAPSAMIEAADRALYVAKHQGRNQVVREGEPLSSLEREAETVSRPEDWSTVLEGESSALVRGLLALVKLRDRDVERHSNRVLRFCARLAKEVVARDLAEISPLEMRDLYFGALLHDVGKVGIPDSILHKPGPLNAREWELVRRHPVEGAQLLENFPELAGAVPVVRSHHERWDGSGYPAGLIGEAIPFGARIFAIADSLDAMWSDRTYRKALPFGQISEEFVRAAGSQFDPALVEAFLNIPESEWEALRFDGEDEFESGDLAA